MADEPAATARSETTRAVILDATVRALRAHGMHGVRVEEIAAAAGISTGLLYYHFADRHELMAAGLREALARASAVTGLEERLGADEASRADVRPWADALRTAVFDADLRDPVARRETEAEQQAATDAGIPASRARALVALADGLRQRVLSDVMDAQRARGLLHAALGALSPAEVDGGR